jgi:hypothetical protein
VCQVDEAREAHKEVEKESTSIILSRGQLDGNLTLVLQCSSSISLGICKIFLIPEP